MPLRPRVLLFAENCNPDWPSLPIVGYKYARALEKVADVTLVTHVRNRENILKAGETALIDRTVYIDNEWIAARMYKLARLLRGGAEVAWSTSQMMAYLPYVAFEYQAHRRFRADLEAGRYDLVHRITPMSPTLPSYIAGRTRQPFILGPLNGNLDWPTAFAAEQKREREGMRRLRGLYKYLPFARSTYSGSACILAAFRHTIDDIDPVHADRIVPLPEIGYDPELFHDGGRQPPFSGEGTKRFLYVGRLVPYKVPEVVVRAFAGSDLLKPHVLHIVGDGPELPRLQAIIAEMGAGDRIHLEGRHSQTEVANFMRRCDAFVFPSIRELGAGVVVEAMACGIACLVTDYGAPGTLAAEGRGIRVPLQPLEGMVRDYRQAMEAMVQDPQKSARMAELARQYARERYTWEAKAAYTLRIYEALLSGRPLVEFTDYA